MLTRPIHILCPPDISAPDFPAKCMAWTDQMRAEMRELVALTRATINESKMLMAEADRMLARK